jgi:tRNA threonylcarbamoyladenosine biosynthesis protein TsaE
MAGQRSSQWLADESATLAAGRQLAVLLKQGTVVYLEGQLGAGKTTLTRGVLEALGHSGAVKSPTYTLVEAYEDLLIPVYHFDLYRLGDAEELDYIGIRDYFRPEAICLVEWPERGRGFLPEPNIRLELHTALAESGAMGRELIISSAN